MPAVKGSQEPLTLEQIESFWQEQARRFGGEPAASWSDLGAIELELRELRRRIQDGDDVLDVGCANGHSTLRLAAEKRVHIRGIDYVPEMIEAARARTAELGGALSGSVEFDVGDILELGDAPQRYDKVVVVRVIINLRSWENQQRGLEACATALRPGGLLLLSEATQQGLARLNGLRAVFGMSPIPVPSFNEYLDEDRVVEFLAPTLELVERVDFASSYFLVTRVLKPLVARIGFLGVDPADPGSRWNRWATRLPAWGDYGTQKLFVFRKRAH